MQQSLKEKGTSQWRVKKSMILFDTTPVSTDFLLEQEVGTGHIHIFFLNSQYKYVINIIKWLLINYQ